MKTTIDIATPLLESAKRKAREEKRTLKDLIEEGLRRTLSDEAPKVPFKLKHHPFKGEGLQPGTAEGDWGTIRDVIYGLK